MGNKKTNYSIRAKKILDMVKLLSDKLIDINKNRGITEDEEIINNLKFALREWKLKESYFESVTDQDLIDLAIYEMEASKIKYIYFLKKAKEKELYLKWISVY